MTSGADQGAQAPAIWALALGQMLTYAGVYYAFPALLPDLMRSTGWTGAQLAAGPTMAFVVTAILTPFTGRLVDRGLGGEMLVLLPVLAAVCVALLGLAPNPAVWCALWALLGLCQSGMYYETCFAFLTRRLAGTARPAITRVTLVAGLAGTLAFPLAHVLSRQIGPAGAFIVFAALILFGAVPLNLFAVRRLRQNARTLTSAHADLDRAALRRAMGKVPFWLIALTFGALGLNHAILITFVLVLFTSTGASAGMATLAAALIGPSQLVGRLALMASEQRAGNAQATLVCTFAIALAALALIFAGAAPWLIFAVAVLQGAGMGCMSILRPVLIAEKLGQAGFGAISGAVAVAPILASAIGPIAGAWAIGYGGAAITSTLVLGLALAGLTITLVLMRRHSSAANLLAQKLDHRG